MISMKRGFLILTTILLTIIFLFIFQSNEVLLSSPKKYADIKQIATCPSPGTPGKEGLLSVEGEVSRFKLPCVETEEEAKKKVTDSGNTCPSWAQRDFDEWNPKNCKVWASSGNLVSPGICSKSTNGPFCKMYYYKTTRERTGFFRWLPGDETIFCFYQSINADAKCSTAQSTQQI